MLQRAVGSSPACLCLPRGRWVRRGVIGLETFIHAKLVCVGNHTQGLTAMQVSKPLPKQLAPLGMKAIMNATHLAILKQSPWSDRSKNPAAGRQIHLCSVVSSERYELHFKKSKPDWTPACSTYIWVIFVHMSMQAFQSDNDVIIQSSWVNTREPCLHTLYTGGDFPMKCCLHRRQTGCVYSHSSCSVTQYQLMWHVVQVKV